MKITLAAAALIAASTSASVISARKLNETSTTNNKTLPEINSLINIAFPMWEVDENGTRVETKSCTPDSCEWNPFYVTKRYDGLHPDFGGHPTDNDVKYAFYASSPFEGQPYPGTNHHCPLDALDDIKAGDCPKIETLSDTDPKGPGHIPSSTMKITLVATALIAASNSPSLIAARQLNGTSSTNTKTLPEINSLIDIAFPMWEVDENGNRVETKSCMVDSCEWNPFYVTKRYDGLHPDFGGHPTDNDVKYAFYASSPFKGQPYPGTNHHCPIDALDDIKAGDCPKIETLSDNDPKRPGHIPPHISLASLTWGVEEELFSMEEMFDYDSYECRVIPGALFKMIRKYYPRTEGEKVNYPPPIVPEGGDFQYEFPAGNGLDNQGPPYVAGPPHWCTEEMLDTGHWDGVCPYVFEGPDAGKYRHPHIALAALEVYLANIAMPEKCSTTWLENNPDFLDPDRVTTDTPFPVMSNDEADPKMVENWLGQPVLPWNYASGDARPGAEGMYVEDTAKLLDIEAAPVPATPAPNPSSAFAMSGSVAAAIMAVIGVIAM
eukprot:CAMPEP_0202028692 /NCGR_PEP_ID=MMETSP0905-20130828/63581_1 /ASSEMBLY_ACC=CAM_ASM_000554 /TAXON_ID=420261 /ORGANISM="Thalassiosira antarctica, Strain CCMP982" /LENGTH=549 /DNA_ID=CAMNT_0048592407 /DNA_START=13 /DNA_END=1663 /DNA_ORIENTATION=+